MTMLDLFAAVALAGIVANSACHPFELAAPWGTAKLAYEYAHAMLREREEQTEQPST